MGQDKIEETTGTPTTPQKQSITCTRCHRTSYHPQDIARKYCGHCRVFLNAGEYIIRDSRQAVVFVEAFNAIWKEMSKLRGYDDNTETLWLETKARLKAVHILVE